MRGLEGKRILVTGASGFVGNHLVGELRMQGAEVLTLDTQDANPIDIRDWLRMTAFAGRSEKIDLVYHLAALMFVPYSFENPREVYEVNVLGTLNTLELCRLYHVEKIVFASSYVYGNPHYLPVDEDHPLNPTSPYARSKVLAEHLCKSYYEDCGLNCTIVRPFNIYGEGQGDSFLIPSIFNQLADGKIELMDPEPRRDYLYIGDAIEAYLRAGNYSKSDFEVFNIGSGVSYSVAEIVGKVVDASGRQEVEVNYQQRRRRAEIMDVVADIHKAKEKLGWEPKVGFVEGLSRYMKWRYGKAEFD